RRVLRAAAAPKGVDSRTGGAARPGPSAAPAVAHHRAAGAGNARSTDPPRPHGTPAARSSRIPLADEPPPRGKQRASPFFSEQVLQRGIVQHRVGQQPLQLGVFGFEAPQPSRLADLEPTVLALPIVERRVAHAVLAAQLRDRPPGLLLLQDPDDLLLRVPRPLHPSLPLRSGLYLLLADFSGSTSAGATPNTQPVGRVK